MNCWTDIYGEDNGRIFATFRCESAEREFSTKDKSLNFNGITVAAA
jgi:hypothetical protein